MIRPAAPLVFWFITQEVSMSSVPLPPSPIQEVPTQLCAPSWKIRPLSLNDALHVSRLMPDLGYPMDHDTAALRLQDMLAHQHKAGLIAFEADQAVGLCQWHVVHSLLADPYLHLDALVVAANHQGRGIGQLLMSSAYAWAMQHGFKEVRLRSRPERKSAHRFYLAQGFEENLTHTFRLTLQD